MLSLQLLKAPLDFLNFTQKWFKQKFFFVLHPAHPGPCSKNNYCPLSSSSWSSFPSPVFLSFSLDSKSIKVFQNQVLKELNCSGVGVRANSILRAELEHLPVFVLMLAFVYLLFVSPFGLQNWLVVTEIGWLTKPKIHAAWPSIETACNPRLRASNILHV